MMPDELYQQNSREGQADAWVVNNTLEWEKQKPYLLQRSKAMKNKMIHITEL